MRGFVAGSTLGAVKRGRSPELAAKNTRKGRPNKRTEESIEKWDRLARTLKIDPVRILFQIAAGKVPKSRRWNPDNPEEMALKAATVLMQYRYPKLRAIEARLADDDRELVFRWLTDSDPDP